MSIFDYSLLEGSYLKRGDTIYKVVAIVPNGLILVHNEGFLKLVENYELVSYKILSLQEVEVLKAQLL